MKPTPLGSSKPLGLRLQLTALGAALLLALYGTDLALAGHHVGATHSGFLRSDDAVRPDGTRSTSIDAPPLGRAR